MKTGKLTAGSLELIDASVSFTNVGGVITFTDGDYPSGITLSEIITADADHNLLDNLQGGNGIDGYYHLTQYEHTWLTDGYVAGYWDTDKGGTGITTYVLGDIIYADGANTLNTLTIGNASDVLTVAGGVPTWAAPTGGSSLFDEIITRTDDLTDANWTPISTAYTMDGYTGYFFKVCAVVFGTLQGAMGEWDFGVNVRSTDLLDGPCSVFMGEDTALQESIMSTITAADGDEGGNTVGFEIKAVLNDYEITWEARATEYVATDFHVRLKIGIIKQAI